MAFDLMDWIVTPSAQAVVAFFVVLFVSSILGSRLRPTWRVLLWLLVLIKAAGLTLPGVPMAVFQPSLERYPTPVVEVMEHWPRAAMILGATSVRAPRMTTRVGSASGWWPFLTAIWGLGVLASLAALARGLIRLRKMERKGRLVSDARVLRLLEECRQSVGLRRSVATVEVEDLAGPAVSGYWNPVVLIPARFWTDLDDEQVRHILLHELSHLKLGHTLLAWIAQAIRTVHWFNPFIHWACWRLQDEAELASDGRVLEILEADRRIRYGQTLLQVQSWKPKPAGVLGLFGQRTAFHRFRQRIDMIRMFRSPSILDLAVSLSVLSVLALLLLGEGRSVVHAAPSIDALQRGQMETVEILRNVSGGLTLWAAETSGEAPAIRAVVDDEKGFLWSDPGCAAIGAQALSNILVPKFLDEVPIHDGWGHELEYCVSTNPTPDSARLIAVRSPGSDGVFDGDVYLPSGFLMTSYGRDLVWADGFFVTWPESPRQTTNWEPVYRDAVGNWQLMASRAGDTYKISENQPGEVFLKASSASASSIAYLFQTLRGPAVANRSIRFSAEVRGDELEGRFGLNVSAGENGKSWFDRTEIVHGSIGWTRLEVDVEIVPETDEVTYGVILNGFGQIEVRKISLRIL